MIISESSDATRVMSVHGYQLCLASRASQATLLEIFRLFLQGRWSSKLNLAGRVATPRRLHDRNLKPSMEDANRTFLERARRRPSCGRHDRGPGGGDIRKSEDQPHAGKLPMHCSPRCGAKTRRGSGCQSPATPNGRCRMHGGMSPGAPKGNSNAFKHGRYTRQAIADRREARPRDEK